MDWQRGVAKAGEWRGLTARGTRASALALHIDSDDELVFGC